MALSPALLELMTKVLEGRSSYDELVRQIAVETNTGNEVGHVEGAAVDLGRQARCGFGEVIYGEGKSAELMVRIIQTQIDAGQSAFVTRIDSDVAFQVRQSFDHATYNPLARTLRVFPSSDSDQILTGDFHAAVISAGSTDAPVAEEAFETLQWMGVSASKFDDIGVAGPQRLLAVIPELRSASAVVVVAGMEGALPAVVAGHLSVPIFAVPTSVGYGASFGGLTPLMGMLSSCAANVAVANIDGGFKGGYLAGMVVRQLQQVSDRCTVPKVQEVH